VNADRGLTVARMVELGGVSRASFYRYDEDAAPRPDRDMDLRDAIQRIALEWPSYGRPRITAALRREGWTVNPKRVYRLLREDNLLCIRKRKFVATTDSNHNRRVYPNLAGQMTLSGINQLWVADITYIRLEAEFIYLAVVIDAFSRRVIGWALDRRMEDDLTLGVRHRSGAQAARSVSQYSSKRPLSWQHRKARMALAPRTVQNMPDCLQREPMTVLQPASITPEPTNRCCARNSG
jgi:putative transposase